jgi:hypothetical protein
VEADAKVFPLQVDRTPTKPQFRSIPWSVAEKAYAVYSRNYGTGQSLERMAQRGGFSNGEMDIYYPAWRDDVDELAKLRAAAATLEARAVAAEVALRALDSPELRDFAAGAVREAAHQRKRWGSDHDAGKTPADWFWLIGYLAGKALHAHSEGRADKALHHTITAAAALANWHAAILGLTNMRPGIEPPKEDSPGGDLALSDSRAIADASQQA